ncbi:unnamed protein product [Hydatigera taeniaeformis]|uniref:AIP3 domain-containing protein n=1 Tax=Hydatigena taeniaeformis TaxID=6205 RepID=A0A158REY3_HYDTA|nr:unnamed protein product [Hydatigera taeniaeformis]
MLKSLAARHITEMIDVLKENCRLKDEVCLLRQKVEKSLELKQKLRDLNENSEYLESEVHRLLRKQSLPSDHRRRPHVTRPIVEDAQDTEDDSVAYTDLSQVSSRLPFSLPSDSPRDDDDVEATTRRYHRPRTSGSAGGLMPPPQPPSPPQRPTAFEISPPPPTSGRMSGWEYQIARSLTYYCHCGAGAIPKINGGLLCLLLSPHLFFFPFAALARDDSVEPSIASNVTQTYPAANSGNIRVHSTKNVPTPERPGKLLMDKSRTQREVVNINEEVVIKRPKGKAGHRVGIFISLLFIPFSEDLFARLAELRRRNNLQPFHLRTNYPVETQVRSDDCFVLVENVHTLIAFEFDSFVVFERQYLLRSPTELYTMLQTVHKSDLEQHQHHSEGHTSAASGSGREASPMPAGRSLRPKGLQSISEVLLTGASGIVSAEHLDLSSTRARPTESLLLPRGGHSTTGIASARNSSPPRATAKKPPLAFEVELSPHHKRRTAPPLSQRKTTSEEDVKRPNGATSGSTEEKAPPLAKVSPASPANPSTSKSGKEWSSSLAGQTGTSNNKFAAAIEGGDWKDLTGMESDSPVGNFEAFVDSVLQQPLSFVDIERLKVEKEKSRAVNKSNPTHALDDVLRSLVNNCFASLSSDLRKKFGKDFSKVKALTFSQLKPLAGDKFALPRLDFEAWVQAAFAENLATMIPLNLHSLQCHSSEFTIEPSSSP